MYATRAGELVPREEEKTRGEYLVLARKEHTARLPAKRCLIN